MTPHQQHMRIEAIASLIDFLDLLEGDCDLEPEEDRCLAGDDNLKVELRPMGYPGDKAGDSDDLEDGGDREEPQTDE